MLEADIMADVCEYASKLLLAELTDKLVVKGKFQIGFLVIDAFPRMFDTPVSALHTQYTCSEAFKMQDNKKHSSGAA